MSGYTTWLVTAPSLPDGRLARAVATQKRVIFEHRQDHVHPVLMRDLEEFSRHLSCSGLYALDLSKLGTPPTEDSYIVRVPDDKMNDLYTFTLRRGEVAGRKFWEFRVRASMMSAELARELNEVVFPGFFGAVVLAPRMYSKKPPAMSLGQFNLGA